MKNIYCPEHISFRKWLDLPPNKKVRFLRTFDKIEANANFKALEIVYQMKIEPKNLNGRKSPAYCFDCARDYRSVESVMAGIDKT